MLSGLSNQRYRLFVLISIIACGFLIYSNTFTCSFHFDDQTSIVQNRAIRNILDLRAIWNFWPDRFITYLSVAFNYHFHQLNVVGYHLFNLVVHLTSSILVWWFVLLTFSTPVMKGEKIAQHADILAFFAGMIFLTHPIQTQAVTYIIQRASSLAALLYLASLSFFIKSRLLQQQGRNPAASRLFYCGSLIAAAMAMFTKAPAITLPFMALLYEIYFLKSKKEDKRKYPVLLLLTVFIIPLTFFLTKSVDFVHMKRTVEIPADISSLQYLLTQSRVMVTYLRLFFFPINQNFIYDYKIAGSLLDLHVLASLIFLFSILAIAFKLFRKNRLISFGIFWFFLTLLPESSFIPIRDVIFEHRLYLPAAGFSLFLTSLIYYLFKNSTLKSVIIALLIITSCYAILTYRRNFIWKDELTLWNDVVLKSPDREIAYNQRGDAYMDLDNIPEALNDYNKAIEINPDYADAYNNRGNVYKAQGKIQRALDDFNKVIEIEPNPADAYNNRGNVYKEQGDIQQALADYNKAIEIDPGLEGIYVNRASIYKVQGKIQQALADYNKAIEINPNRASIYNNRGNIYKNQGKIQLALADYNKAIEINPNYAYAYYNRGYMYKEQGEIQLALADYNKAIELNPNIIGVYLRRGNAYRKQGDMEQALADYEKAIEIDPNRASIYNNRGNAYRKQGDMEQALADYEKAIEIDPDYSDTYNSRAVVYYLLKEYDKAWADVHKAEILGYKANTEDLAFVEKLKKDSGRDR